jgi:hypothetical protein
MTNHIFSVCNVQDWSQNEMVRQSYSDSLIHNATPYFSSVITVPAFRSTQIITFEGLWEHRIYFPNVDTIGYSF